MMCKKNIFKKYNYPEIDRPEDFSLFLKLIYKKYSFDILEENLYSYYIQSKNLEKKYEKIRIFSSNYIKIFLKNIGKYWNNIYFWFRFLIVVLEYILTRNKLIFNLFY